MSSFSLKIKSTPVFASKKDEYNVDTYIKGLVLTFPRDQLPHHLQGRVPLSVWQDTYDQLIMCFKEDAEITGYIAESPFKIIFRMGKVVEKSDALEAKFQTMANQQASIYQQYGVNVSLAKDADAKKKNKVDKKCQNMRFLDQVEGLRFEIATQ